MKVTARASALYDMPREELFPRATHEDTIPKIVLPTGPLPGVERTSLLDATEQAKGVRRAVALTDGAILTETITVWDPPRVHAYRVEGFRGPLSLIATHIDSRWDFCSLDKNKTTRIDWTYDIHLTSAAALPVAVPLAKVFVTQLMQGALDRLKTL